MDVVTLGAALSIMKKMPDTAASSAAAAEDAADRAEAAAEQAEVSARASAESLEMISTEGVNLWNPTASYVQQNAAGDSKSGYTINVDGSVKCIRNCGAYGG